jgi:hypothetical protein
VGRQRSVTAEDVKAAVAEIEAEGKAAGVVAVMTRVGGSHAVVKDLLDKYRGERRESLGAALEAVIEEEQEGGIPAALRPVVDGLAQAWKSMVAAERERADIAIVSAQQASDRRVFAAERRLAGVQQALEATETQLVEAIERAETAEKKAARVEGRAQKLSVDLAAAQARLERPHGPSASVSTKRKPKHTEQSPTDETSPGLV